MKRQLLQNTKVLPYTQEKAVDKSGFQSAVFAVVTGATGDVKILIEHSDTESGDFTELKAPCVFLEKNEVKNLQAKDLVNFDLDISGCKKFIKIKTSGTATASATYALALGDSNVEPE